MLTATQTSFKIIILNRQARILAHEKSHGPKVASRKVVKSTKRIVKKDPNGKIKDLEDYLNMGNREESLKGRNISRR